MTVRKESLGRMATFLVPMQKLKTCKVEETTLEEHIHRFLLSQFHSYTYRDNVPGWWREPSSGKEHYDIHRHYEVSFLGKERVSTLEEFLSEVARASGEMCIYITTGEDAWLIYA